MKTRPRSAAASFYAVVCQLRNLSSCFLHLITTHDRVEFHRSVGQPTDQYYSAAVIACFRRVTITVAWHGMAAQRCTWSIMVVLKNSTVFFRPASTLLRHANSDHASVFTALHVMQTRSSDQNSVCPSVCLSVCQSVCHTRELWQNGRKICPDLYTIWKII